MKKIIFFLFSIVFAIGIDAQVYKTVTISAGGLHDALAPEDFITVTNLTINGSVNAADFLTMRDEITVLSVIDLSGATIDGNKIPDEAFYFTTPKTGKLSLTQVILPASVTALGDYAFYGCYNLATINLPTSLQTIGSWTFADCHSLIVDPNLPSSLTSMGVGAFVHCHSLPAVNIPSSITYIDNWTFAACFNLVSITIPSSVTAIYNNAFKNCQHLPSITIPSTVNYLGYDVFYNCFALTTVDLSQTSVAALLKNTFYNCNNLQTIKIPATVTAIGDSAFYQCSALTGLYAYPQAPADLSTSKDVFLGVSNSACTLYVPLFKKSDYQNALQWKNFLNIAVMKLPSTITATGETSYTYNNSPQGPASADVTGSTGTKSYKYSGTGSTSYPESATPPTNVGTYQVVATVATDENYLEATSAPLAFTINKKDVTVTAGHLEKTYGDNNPTLTAVVTGAIEGGDAVNYSLATTAVKLSGVGDYPISVTLGSNPNYNITKTDNTLTVNAKDVTIAADHLSKTYGDDNPTLTAVVSGAIEGGEAVNYSLATTAVKLSGIGDYPISVTLSSNPNYNITKTDNTLTVKAKDVTIAADHLTKTYGNDNPTLTAVVTGTFEGGDAVNYSLATTAVKLSGIGDYPISITLGSNPNYNITKTNNTLTITSKSIFVTANAQSKSYGDPDPTLTFTNSPALVGSDAFSGALVRDAGENVGTYTIRQGDLALSNNYLLTFTEALLTINKASSSISVVGSATFTYNGNQQGPDNYSKTGSSGAVTYKYRGTGATYYKNSSTPPTNTGTYQVIANLVADDNYYGASSVPFAFSINQKNVTVTADHLSKTYGEDNPTLTATVNGAVEGGDAVDYSLATTAVKLSDVGDYPISITLGSNPNYNITKTDNTLTVNAKAATITANHLSKTYGDNNPTLTAVITGTVTGGDAVNYSLATTAVKLSDVGDYPISVTLGSNPNYNITKTDNTLTVNSKAATITANHLSKEYGDNNPTLTAVVTGTVTGGDAVNYSLATTAVKLSDVGDYPISITLESNPNYNITKTDNTLTVTTKSISVTANALSKMHGDPDPALTFINSPELAGSDAFSGTLIRDAGESVGSYAIRQGSLALSSNYSITFTGALLTITSATSSITVTGTSSLTYNGSPQGPATSTHTGSTGAVSYAYKGTGSTSYSESSTPPANAGTYQVVATLAADENYSGASSVPFNFTIAKANATISVVPYDVKFDNNEHVATGTATGVIGEDLSNLLDLSLTRHTAVDAYTDSWSFAGNSNYNSDSGSITDRINLPTGIITTEDHPMKVIVYQTPGSSMVNFKFTPKYSGRVTIVIYNTTGFEITRLTNKEAIADQETIIQCSTNLPLGLYTYRLVCETYYNSGKFIVSR